MKENLLLFSAFATGAYAGFNAVNGSDTAIKAVGAAAVGMLGAPEAIAITSMVACTGAMSGAALAVVVNLGNALKPMPQR
ncbi:MAG TPA: hypothetical protein VLG38_01505 [Gammaproteobacteria bacterium]|nr:hypothetical protein [Gammaproteobacteria bacterium]